MTSRAGPTYFPIELNSETKLGNMLGVLGAPSRFHKKR